MTQPPHDNNFKNARSIAFVIYILLGIEFPRYINIRRGQVICAILGGWALCPWEILASAQGFLSFMNGYTVFLGPIAGIMVADYWIVHKGKVDVPAMYRPHGRYRYSYGFNWRAIVAILCSVPPNLPGLFASINPKIDVGGAFKIFDFAWLFGFFVASVVYSTLSLGFPAKETYIPKAITSEDVGKNVLDESTESEKSSHQDKEVMEVDLKLV